MQQVQLRDIPDRVGSPTYGYMYPQATSEFSGRNLPDVLNDIRQNNLVSSLEQPQTARAELIRYGLSAILADRFCLLSDVDGFERLLDAEDPPSQLEIDRFVRLAVESTGFHREVVLGLVSEITSALGTALMIIKPGRHTNLSGESVQYGQSRQNGQLEKLFLKKRKEARDLCHADALTSYTIPPGYYTDELLKIRADYESWHKAWREQGNIPTPNLDSLQLLCTIGVPEALYYRGLYLLALSQSMDAMLGKLFHARAVQLLERSAAAGNSNAASTLGDLYFDDGKEKEQFELWNLAAAYYTGYGMPALNKKRRENLIEMLNRQEENRQRVRWAPMTPLILFPLLLLWVWYVPVPPPAFLPRPFPGLKLGIPFRWLLSCIDALSLLISLALCVTASARVKRNPYCQLNNLPLRLLLFWLAVIVAFGVIKVMLC